VNLTFIGMRLASAMNFSTSVLSPYHSIACMLLE
jgi:hypothetical protein